MTFGELAGLIAAIAFAALVIFISINLSKLSEVIREVKETVKKVNNAVDVVTRDVDNLSIEVEGLLNKTNTLVDDVNGKLSKTDPLFTAIGDLGQTVSDVNESSKEMASNLISGISAKNKRKQSALAKITNIAKPRRNTRNKVHTSPAAHSNQNSKQYWTKEEKELFDLSNKQPSRTAGDIKVVHEDIK